MATALLYHPHLQLLLLPCMPAASWAQPTAAAGAAGEPAELQEENTDGKAREHVSVEGLSVKGGYRGRHAGQGGANCQCECCCTTLVVRGRWGRCGCLAPQMQYQYIERLARNLFSMYQAAKRLPAPQRQSSPEAGTDATCWEAATLARTTGHLATRPTVLFLQPLLLRERVWFARDMLIALSRIKRLNCAVCWLSGEPERCLFTARCVLVLVACYR